MIRELKRKCVYCQRDMSNSVSALSYKENPYCNTCCGERIELAEKEIGQVVFRNVNSGYIEPIPVEQTRNSSI